MVRGLPALRPYQAEAARAVLASVAERRGLTFTVMMARQAGKNELSAQLELLLLLLHAGRPGAQGVKASPTYKPQTINSLRRLRQRLADAGLGRRLRAEQGYILGLGGARWLFFSAQPGAHVVGATASILLEGDEAQDLEPEKWNRDFRPMGATTNATAVLYGTAWSTDGLLEETRQANLELQARDGVRRHFEYPWTVVAEHLPDYGRYVEGEIARLGAGHPLIRTQYELQPLEQGGRLLSPAQLALLEGDHPAEAVPTAGPVTYVAGIDFAGEEEGPGEGGGSRVEGGGAAPVPLLSKEGGYRRDRDSTALVIGWVAPHSPAPSPHLWRGGGEAGGEASARDGASSPSHFTLHPSPSPLRLTYARTWRGVKHPQVLAELATLLELWRVRRAMGDATGIGEAGVSFLVDRLGSRVEPFRFTAPAKSELAFRLLARINAGAVRLPRTGFRVPGSEFRVGDGGNPEPGTRNSELEVWGEVRRQMRLLRGSYRPGGLLGFSVAPAEGHDDLAHALALAVEAATRLGDRPRVAQGKLRV